jgi:hypothetical protein
MQTGDEAPAQLAVDGIGPPPLAPLEIPREPRLLRPVE